LILELLLLFLFTLFSLSVSLSAKEEEMDDKIREFLSIASAATPEQAALLLEATKGDVDVSRSSSPIEKGSFPSN